MADNWADKFAEGFRSGMGMREQRKAHEATLKYERERLDSQQRHEKAIEDLTKTAQTATEAHQAMIETMEKARDLSMEKYRQAEMERMKVQEQVQAAGLTGQAFEPFQAPMRTQQVPGPEGIQQMQVPTQPAPVGSLNIGGLTLRPVSQEEQQQRKEVIQKQQLTNTVDAALKFEKEGRGTFKEGMQVASNFFGHEVKFDKPNYMDQLIGDLMDKGHSSWEILNKLHPQPGAAEGQRLAAQGRGMTTAIQLQNQARQMLEQERRQEVNAYNASLPKGKKPFPYQAPGQLEIFNRTQELLGNAKLDDEAKGWAAAHLQSLAPGIVAAAKEEESMLGGMMRRPPIPLAKPQAPAPQQVPQTNPVELPITNPNNTQVLPPIDLTTPPQNWGAQLSPEERKTRWSVVPTAIKLGIHKTMAESNAVRNSIGSHFGMPMAIPSNRGPQ